MLFLDTHYAFLASNYGHICIFVALMESKSKVVHDTMGTGTESQSFLEIFRARVHGNPASLEAELFVQLT